MAPFRQLAHPATLISIVALLFATAGGSFAAGSLIGSKQIADHSIQLRDLSPSAIAALRGRVGPQGPEGPRGPAGVKGTFDPAKVFRVVGPQLSVAPGQTADAQADCPAGSIAIGGGGSLGYGFVGSVPFVATGQGAPTAWVVVDANSALASVNIEAMAVCASP